MSSDAVGSERISRIIGYKLAKGNFQTVGANLPQRVAIFAEANYANQATLDTNAKAITSAQQAGELYGYGSPIEIIARILFPKSGGGIGGIPVVVYPQAEASGATPKIIKIVPTGTATDNGTHTLKIAGRTGLDSASYDVAIVEGDTVGDIVAKMADVVNNVLNAPVIGTDYDYEARFETKWRGFTANDLDISIVDNGNDCGISYAFTTVSAGAQTPSVAGALAQFGAIWNTLVINSYGLVPSVMSALEAFNGKPDPENPTGRYTAIVMKPLIAISGSTSDDPSAITDTRQDDVTIAVAPAPLSKGWPMEAAANMALLCARTAQDTPHLDVEGKTYQDMPTPTSIGSMADYNNRDAIVKKGCSTVDLVGGLYMVQDFVTTYHKVGENPPQYRYVRNLIVDFNVFFTYFNLQQTYVVDHVLANDNDTVTASKVVKPKTWKQVLGGMFDDLGKRALIADTQFSKSGLVVTLSGVNPDRLETNFPYKRTGVGRVLSTTVEAGFNFGNV